MTIKSDNTYGNPYHDEGDGKFTSPNGSGTNGGSISVVPLTTSSGKQRRFYSDYSDKEQQALLVSYNSRHGSELDIIAKLAIEYDTSLDKSENRERKREEWLIDEYNSQMSTPKKYERKATILLGLPGSGKSTIANLVKEQNGAFEVDADIFKEKHIPEFQKDLRMISAVHEESVDLSNRFRRELSDQGANMVIGKVGGDYERIGQLLDELQQSGYQVDVVLNDVPLETAMDRTVGRYERKETNRLVPLHVLLHADKNVFNTFDQILKHGAVVGGKIYSNDVPKGMSPSLLKEFRKGE